MMLITIPNGKRVSIDAYVRAWKLLKTLPPQEPVKGWTWWAENAQVVLRDIGRGCQDRINRHDRTMHAGEVSPRRIYAKIRTAAVRGAIRDECRWCGSPLDPLAVNPNNANTRLCHGCRSY